MGGMVSTTSIWCHSIRSVPAIIMSRPPLSSLHWCQEWSTTQRTSSQLVKLWEPLESTRFWHLAESVPRRIEAVLTIRTFNVLSTPVCGATVNAFPIGMLQHTVRHCTQPREPLSPSQIAPYSLHSALHLTRSLWTLVNLWSKVEHYIGG
jgi:hypothetical protein